jgi:hypothetical protein
MEDGEKRRLITEYIYNNPNCNKQSVVRALYGKLSRVPVINTIKELCEDNVITARKENQNSRDHKLSVNTGNILFKVSKELDDFDKSFFVLLKRVSKEYDRLYSHKIPRDSQQRDILNLLSECFHIFYELVDIYLVRSVLEWPKIVTDRETKRQIYSMVFTKIIDIYLRMSETCSSRKLGFLASNTTISFQRRIYYTEKLIHHFNSFTNGGMEKEIDDVLECMWNINNDFKRLAFPEPVVYGWKFDYTKDGWKDLIELHTQNPDKSYRNAVESNRKKNKGRSVDPEVYFYLTKSLATYT